MGLHPTASFPRSMLFVYNDCRAPLRSTGCPHPLRTQQGPEDDCYGQHKQTDPWSCARPHERQGQSLRCTEQVTEEPLLCPSSSPPALSSCWATLLCDSQPQGGRGMPQRYIVTRWLCTHVKGKGHGAHALTAAPRVSEPHQGEGQPSGL